MGAARRIRQRMRRVMQSAAIRGDTETTQTTETTETTGERGVNLSTNANVVISANAGEDGSVRATSTRQRVTVRQDGRGTHEETHTTETRFP